MGMGYSGCYGDIISDENLEKLCPETFKAFMESLNENPEDAPHPASSLMFNDGECGEIITGTYEALQKDFKTKTGLELNIGYHDADNDGDRYDEVGDVYWTVDGMWQYTPAGKKMKDIVERKTWVQFG